MADKEKQCTGECIKCSFQQQVYCSVQRTYTIMGALNTLATKLEAIEKSLTSIESMLSSEGLIDPFKIEEKAQDGRGADNSSPSNNNN